MNIDFGKIRQEKVKKFMLKHGLDKSAGFQKIKPACYNPAFEASYRKHLETYIIKKNIKTVWNTYKTIHPREAWNGMMVSFGIQYSRSSHSINYLHDTFSEIEKGQIVIINLRLLWGLLNIAVAHEVGEVSEEDYLIKLCYMQSGASEGSQWISLRETQEGFTEVTHLSLYKSKSKFRDTKLYPRLHTRAITEFHASVKKKAELMTE